MNEIDFLDHHTFRCGLNNFLENLHKNLQCFVLFSEELFYVQYIKQTLFCFSTDFASCSYI